MIKKNLIKGTAAIMMAALVLTGCASSDITDALNTSLGTTIEQTQEDSLVSTEGQQDGNAAPGGQQNVAKETEKNLSSSSATVSSSTLLDTSDMFSDRDLEQEADLTDAIYMTVESGEDITITQEGVYVISGTATDSTIIVEAEDTAKVQIVLDGVSITNTDSPAIYVKSADKIFVTTTDSTNTLKVTGTFTADGDTNTDAVIFSKEDLVLNGVGTLTIQSTDNGISCKDDLKITGGTYNITSGNDAIEANDSIRVYDGNFNIDSGKDGLQAENEDDDTVGYIYITGGTFDIDADSDGIQATSVLMIDGGTFDITAGEGLEGTYVQINDGTINIEASDDGINATQKSSAYEVVIEINGGDITINMGSGDTDALDANGYLYINGGTVNITAQFAFDFDKGAELNGGTVTVNGEEVTEITESMQMGGGGMGGFGGGQGGFGGGQAGDGNQMQGGFGGQNDQNSGNAQGGDGQMPELPEGFDSSQMPGNGQAPDGTQMQGGRQGGGKQH